MTRDEAWALLNELTTNDSLIKHALGVEAIQKFRQAWLGQSPDDVDQADRRALANYCHAVLNSGAFLYVD